MYCGFAGKLGKKMTSIHPSSFVSPNAKLGKDIEIGPFSIIHPNVTLGDRVKIGAHCELGIATPLGDGTPLVIGNDSLIRSHSVFYESSRIGAKLTTGHYVVVRENTIGGEGLQFGTSSEIQGDCTFGDYVRLQSNVFIGKKTVIGDYVWILPYAVLTNDPTPPSNVLLGCIIEDFASISASALIMPGVRVGHHSLVAAKACVTKDVPPYMVVAGVPAKIKGETKAIKLRDGSDRPAYPWTTHFSRGYPDSVLSEWAKHKSEQK